MTKHELQEYMKQVREQKRLETRIAELTAEMQRIKSVVLSDAPKGKGKSNFAWNVGGGIEYALTSNVCLDLGYRYTDLGNAEAKNRTTGDKYKEDVKYNDIKLGMQYYF